MQTTTLVLGGYGNFGKRICRALAANPSIALIVGGRDVQQAEALAVALGHGARGAAVDRASPDLARSLRMLNVDLVIHAAGPFQHQDYHVAEAAAMAGAHYIDLADGRRFVCDFPRSMGAAFRNVRRVAVSGASSVPGLSSAVVDRLCEGWTRVDSIDTCIGPAQTAPRGLATLAGVLSYCGKPVRVWQDGRWQTQRGWGHPASVTFAEMSPRLGALCDIPDLELFPSHYNVRERVIFRAALELGLAQRVLAAVATLHANGWLAQPARFAGLMHRTAGFLDVFGSARGGMVVRAAGMDAAGTGVRIAWHLTADHDHGPEIPCMPAILLARRLAEADPIAPGAYACLGLLRLDDFEPEFSRWGMRTEIVNETAGASPL